MTEDRSSESPAEPETPAFPPSDCPMPIVSHTQEVIANIPYALMLLLGAAVCWLTFAGGLFGGLSAALYVAYGVAGAFWIMLFVCPFCHFYDTRLCPCGYGQIAVHLRPKRDGSLFARQFRRHIPVIVPLWFIPVIVGVVAMVRSFSWLMLILVVAFAINSFVLLPLLGPPVLLQRMPPKTNLPLDGRLQVGGVGGPAAAAALS